MSAGASARAEAERARQKAARLERYAEMYEKGAVGEENTGAALSQLGPEWTVLHDQRWPGRRMANIDHIVVGPAGIFVIDSKNWSGSVTVAGDRLLQNGRSRERQVAGVVDSALAVAELAGQYAVHVHPVMCLVESTGLTGWARDVMLCSPGNITSMLSSRPVVFASSLVPDVATRLEAELRAAVPSTPLSSPAPRPSAPTKRASRGREKTARVELRKLLVLVAGVAAFVAVAPTALSALSERVTEAVVMSTTSDLSRAGLPDGLGRPAGRALAAANVSTLADVARMTEKELLAMHGVGPRALGVLRAALQEHGRDLAQV